MIMQQRVVESPYYTATEAAAYLRSTKGGIYALVKRGRLKPMPGTRRLLFNRAVWRGFWSCPHSDSYCKPAASESCNTSIRDLAGTPSSRGFGLAPPVSWGSWWLYTLPLF